MEPKLSTWRKRHLLCAVDVIHVIYSDALYADHSLTLLLLSETPKICQQSKICIKWKGDMFSYRWASTISQVIAVVKLSLWYEWNAMKKNVSQRFGPSTLKCKHHQRSLEARSRLLQKDSVCSKSRSRACGWFCLLFLDVSGWDSSFSKIFL